MRSTINRYRRSKIGLVEIKRGQCLQKIEKQPGSVDSLGQSEDYQCGLAPTASFSYFL